MEINDVLNIVLDVLRIASLIRPLIRWLCATFSASALTKKPAREMERKSVIVVRWKRTGKVEGYSSLSAFCAAHPQYPRYRIYSGMVDGTYADHVLELRRAPFKPHPYKTRRGGIKRAKPGPKGPRTKRS